MKPLIVSLPLCLTALAAWGAPNPLYFSATGSGAMSGVDPADCQTETWANTAGNIPAGTPASPQVVVAIGQCSVFNVPGNYITLEIPGGSSIVDSIADANPPCNISVPAGAVGLTIDGSGGGYIGFTDNGTLLAHQSACSAIRCAGAMTGLTVKNLMIKNVYVHTSASDSAVASDSCVGISCDSMAGSNFFSGLLFSNAGTAIYTQGACTNVTSNCAFVNCNHGVVPSGTATASWSVQHCFFESNYNWATIAGTYHNDEILWNAATPGTTIGAITITGNTFNGVQGLDSTTYIFLEQGGGNPVLLANNLFIVNPGDTLNDGCFSGGAACHALNNTFINNGPPQVAFNQAANLTFMNNLLVNFGTFDNFNFSLSGSVISNNIYLNPQTGSGFSPWTLNGAPYAAFAAWTSASGDGASQYFSGINATTVVNTNTGLLTASSPAIGTGNTNAYALGVTTDLSGNPRAANGPMDIGAFAANAPAGPAPPTGLHVVSP